MSLCNISWEDFDSHSRQTFSNLYLSPNFSDVTLVSNDGQHTPSHKFVLSSGSSVLEQMLNSNSSFTNQIIYLPTLNNEDLLPVLQFLYHGETKLCQSQMTAFFKIASDLKIQTLCNANNQDQVPNARMSSPNLKVPYHENEPITRTPYKPITHPETVNHANDSNDHVAESFYNEDNEYYEVQTEDNYIDNDTNKNNEHVDEIQAEPEKFGETIFEQSLNENSIKSDALQLPLQKDSEAKEISKELSSELRNIKEQNSLDPVVCDLCGKVFSSSQSMHNHYQTIHLKEKYHCEKCDYQATQKEALKLHVNAIHSKVQIPCNQCNFEGNSNAALKSHMKKYHSNFPCTICPFVGKSAGKLRTHIEEKHDGTKFPCNKCPYQASTPGHLAFHKKLHCTICGKVIFGQKDQHMLLHNKQ